MLKFGQNQFILIGVIAYVILGLPVFYFISGELNQTMLWKSALPFLIALMIVYFLFFRKR